MSKKSFKKVMQEHQVIAVASKVIRNSKGEVVKTLYDIYQTK